MRRLCYCIVLFAGCATNESSTIEPYLDDDKADGHPAHLEYSDRSHLDMEEPSDLVLADGDLYAVSDQHSKIYAVKPDGDADEFLNVEGTDLEALGYDPKRGEFLIGDEATAKIWTIDALGKRHDSIKLDSADDGNSGIEGIVVTPDQHLFAVKEKDPAKIYELDAEGNLLVSQKLDFAHDISAITYNPLDNHLYVLSDEDHALFRLTKTSKKPDRAWKLPVKHPEGIAFDGNTLYVVSDSEARIYTFDLVN
jgi:uncharacterized protein YjiK